MSKASDMADAFKAIKPLAFEAKTAMGTNHRAFFEVTALGHLNISMRVGTDYWTIPVHNSDAAQLGRWLEDVFG